MKWEKKSLSVGAQYMDTSGKEVSDKDYMPLHLKKRRNAVLLLEMGTLFSPLASDDIELRSAWKSIPLDNAEDKVKWSEVYAYYSSPSEANTTHLAAHKWFFSKLFDNDP